jgi:hypothetical protein
MADEKKADIGTGSYFGELILKPLPDGRLMQLMAPFGFQDAQQKKWPVPKGTKVDGASIPQVLWTLIGGPFEGKYREASVVHDFYCDTRTEPWKAVHRVFYEGMLVSGVSGIRAKLMYAAVRHAGPKWADSTVDNNRLPRNGGLNTLTRHPPTAFSLGVRQAVTAGPAPLGREVFTNSRSARPTGRETTLDLDQLEALIAAENPSLDDIDEALDEATQLVEAPAGLPAPAATRILKAQAGHARFAE